MCLVRFLDLLGLTANLYIRYFAHVLVNRRFCFFVLLIMDLMASKAGPISSIRKLNAKHVKQKLQIHDLMCAGCTLSHTSICMHMCTIYAHAHKCMHVVPLVWGLIPNVHEWSWQMHLNPKWAFFTNLPVRFNYGCYRSNSSLLFMVNIRIRFLYVVEYYLFVCEEI